MSYPMERVSKKLKGLRGLVQVSNNTCFLNSLIQCLSFTHELRDYFSGHEFNSDLVLNFSNSERAAIKYTQKNKLSYRIAEVILTSWKESIGTIRAGALHRVFLEKFPYFRENSGEHEDPNEAMMHILNQIHQEIRTTIKDNCEAKNLYSFLPLIVQEYIEKRLELNKKQTDKEITDKEFRDTIAKMKETNPEYEECFYIMEKYFQFIHRDGFSILCDILQGIYISQLKCLECGNTSTHCNPEFVLPVEIPDKEEEEKAYKLLEEGRKKKRHREDIDTKRSESDKYMVDLVDSESDSEEEKMTLEAFQKMRKRNKEEENKLKKFTLQECLDNYFQVEKLGIDELWKCDKCDRKVPSVKKLGIFKPPKILNLLVKRYSAHYNVKKGEMEFKRKSNKIIFPLKELDLTAHVAYNPDNKKYIYDLYALSNQIPIGSNGLNLGHYTSCCLHPQNNKWYLFDDDDVGHVSSDDVLEKSKEYLFFYRLRE